MHKHYRRLLLVFVIYAALLSMLFLTSPTDLPLPLVVVPFLLLFLSITLTIRLILAYYGKTTKRHTTIAVMLGFAPVMLLILQSIGQLSPRDVSISLLFVAITAFYIGRLRFSKSDV